MSKLLGRASTAYCVLRGHHVIRMVMQDVANVGYFLLGYRCLTCQKVRRS